MTKGMTCGLDEAGRGPLAGPVTAGCVVLPADFPQEVLGDSKVLTQNQREKAFALIQERAAWGLGWCDASEIDQINILQASLKAMRRAFDDLKARFPLVEIAGAIVDGLYCPVLSIPCTAMVKADALEPCVSAASIVAKVSRDRFMTQAHADDPRYGFATHKGYPTLAHRKALEEYGPGPLHRLTFTWKRPKQK
jgi:ribonuclease HII